MSKSYHLVTLGRELRRRRESFNMTLEDLAQRSGLTQNYIGSIENGRRDPSLSTIIGLARGLGINPLELFGSVPGLSPAAEEVARLFESTTDDVQTAVFMLLHNFDQRRRGTKAAAAVSMRL